MSGDTSGGLSRGDMDTENAFALANEPDPTTGWTPLHYAASRGQLERVRWLVEECGAMVGCEDREGETALHKAALYGRLPTLSYLLSETADADPNAADNDGWTALHNAASKGYLDIIRVLIEQAGANVNIKGGRGGYTPLMNAASKGHLPVVRYLTAKQHADPFVHNNFGETAYDVAAATFEVYICHVLEKYEAERWAALKFSSPAQSQDGPSPVKLGQGAYNPLVLHSTVPVLVYENQRLDTRLKTLAYRGGKPRWSATSAGRRSRTDRRAPFTIPPGSLNSTGKHVPVFRSDVQLPKRDDPYHLPLPSRVNPSLARRGGRSRPASRLPTVSEAPIDIDGSGASSTPTPSSVLATTPRASSASSSASASASEASVERSHFWLSDWTPDLTHPRVDVDDGWQYARSFDDPEERWTAEQPPLLRRLLSGGASGVGGVVGSAAAMGRDDEERLRLTGWVRRRRWVRIMRRRVDIELGDPVPGEDAWAAAHGEGVDYLTRAEFLAGGAADGHSMGVTTPSAEGTSNGVDESVELRRKIARLESAVSELRSGCFTDDNAERRSRGEDLLKRYTLELGLLREFAGDGLVETEYSDEDDDDDDEDEEFIYPGSSRDDGMSTVTGRTGYSRRTALAPSPFRSGSYFPSAPSVISYGGESSYTIRAATPRSQDLAAAPGFRVPTNEMPSKAPVRRGDVPQPHNLQPQWERDEDANECRRCQRRFTFFVRKHHCRRCGLVVCAQCSTHRVPLDPTELVLDPAAPETWPSPSYPNQPLLHRICDQCDAELKMPNRLRNAAGEASSRAGEILLGGRSGRRNVDENERASDISSNVSELTECPVCNTTLASLGSAQQQEEHVKDCLDNGGGGSVQSGRYLVYKLPANSPIVGKECIICMEEFTVTEMIARLPCLCYFHRTCISAWYNRGKSCPVHARTW